MQEAVAPGEGAMIAVIGMELNEIEKEINLLPKTGICEIANDNSNSQVVVSGTKKNIEILNENLKKKKKESNNFTSKCSFSLFFNEKSF